jgi:hypothetical protein
MPMSYMYRKNHGLPALPQNRGQHFTPSAGLGPDLHSSAAKRDRAKVKDRQNILVH